MRQYMLPLLLFLLTLTIPQSVSAEKIPPGVLMILNQVDQVYIKPSGKDTRYYFVNNPVSYASIIGLTFHRQIIYAKQKQKYKKELNILAKDLYAYLKNLAKIHHYKDPRSGKAMPEKLLLSKFHYAAKGKMNAWVIKNKGIDPAGVKQPFILNRVTVAQHILPPERDTEPNYRFEEAEDESDGIVLLDQEAEGPVKSSGEVCPKYSSATKEEKDKLIRVGAKIDTNNNPDDRTYLECKYAVNAHKDIILQEEQTPYKEGKKDGLYIRYLTHKDGTRYLKNEVVYKNNLKNSMFTTYLYMPDYKRAPKPFLYSQTPYVNGKRKGLEKQFAYTELGERHVEWETPYKNDKIDGVRIYHNVEYAKKPYLSGRITYENGKKHGLDISYERDGRTIKRKDLYHNGKLVQ